MVSLRFEHLVPPIQHVLCLGAHCDDLEIGCGGTVLKLATGRNPPAFTWVVFSSDATREAEALQSARVMLPKSSSSRIIIKKFRDGFLPYEGSVVKETFEELKETVSPDLILTHYRGDLHQDHRLISELTWNTFRDHLILEYEIPKYDGDLGVPNVFVPLSERVYRDKVSNLMTYFESQRDKAWFKEDTFLSILRLRGIECNSASGYAEGFYSRKIVL